jgi:chemotaxis protein CheX
MQPDHQHPPFKIEQSENFILVSLSGRPGVEFSKNFEQEIMKTLETQLKPVIFDCKTLEELSPHWTRILAVLSQNLKSGGTGLRLIDPKVEVEQAIRQNGLAHVLPTSPTLHAAKIALGILAPRRIDVNFINPFIMATIRVLEIQAQVKAKPGQPYRRDPKERFTGDISGVIGLVSDNFVGAVVISFPEKTFLSIMSNMLGEAVTQLSQEIADGAGELTNIIFGQAKVALNDQGFGIKTAIPTVVTGAQHNVHTQTTGPRVALPFESTAGPFTIEVCLSE